MTDLQELMALLEKATPGVWTATTEHVTGGFPESYVLHGIDADGSTICSDYPYDAYAPGPNDQVAIAVAINFLRSAAFAEMVKDAQRLDWMAHHGASLRQDPGHSGGWWFVIAPYHTKRKSVDDRTRFPTARAAIDAAIKGNGP